MRLLQFMQTVMLVMLPIIPAFAQDWWPLSITVYLNGQSENQLRGIHTARQQVISVEIMDIAPVIALEEELSVGLSPDTDRARRQLERRINRASDDEKLLAVNAARARSEAVAYGIQQFPAIVIDDLYVAEGEFDIRRAVRLWRQQKLRQDP